MIIDSEDLFAEAEQAILDYGAARVKFRSVQERLKGARLLFGNDNKVGVAGEYWALRLYLIRGYSLHEIPTATNNASYDFVVQRSSGQLSYIQVKAITAENKAGKTTFVQSGGQWDEICVVEMDEYLRPRRFGIASHDDFIRRCKAASGQMPANRRWLDEAWMNVVSASLIPRL